MTGSYGCQTKKKQVKYANLNEVQKTHRIMMSPWRSLFALVGLLTLEFLTLFSPWLL